MICDIVRGNSNLIVSRLLSLTRFLVFAIRKPVSDLRNVTARAWSGLVEPFVVEPGFGGVGAAVVVAVLIHVGSFDFLGSVVERVGGGVVEGDDKFHLRREDGAVHSFYSFRGYSENSTHYYIPCTCRAQLLVVNNATKIQ